MFKISIPVFCYHNVSHEDGHTPALFGQHLDAIADAGYRTLSSLDLLKVVRGEKKADRKSVVLTFDDGHVSNWLTCVPELEKRGMTGTFFVLTDFTEQGDARTQETAPAMSGMPEAFKSAHRDQDYSQFLNENEIKAMLSKGMEVFSHGCAHQPTFRTLRPINPMAHTRAHWGAWAIYNDFNEKWPTFDIASGYAYDGFWPQFDEAGEPQFNIRQTSDRLEFCRRDFAKSLERIRELNGSDTQLFCWPWGQFCDDAEAELKKAGYHGAFTQERWANSKGTDPFRLNRIGVGKQKDGDWIQQRLGMYSTGITARVFFKRYRKKPEVKNILYATDSKILSGGSRQMINNIGILSSKGFRTHAIVHPESAVGGELEKMDVNVIPFDDFSTYLKAGKFLKDVAKQHDIDVVHSFHNRAYKMGVIARALGAKFKMFINRGVISRPNAIFFLWTALANGVICNSKACADVLQGYGVLEKRLNVIYNAFCAEDLGERKPQKKRGTRFVYAGNAAPNKGHALYLEAAAKVCEGDCRDLEFVSIGIPKGQSRRAQKHMPPALQERWHSTGRLPHHELLEELHFADVICIPPNLGMESFPNTLMEGFNASLAGVCTKAGGIPEMLHHGVNGFLCDIGDADCLAKHMRLLAEDPALRYNMGQVGRAVVRQLLTPEAKARGLLRVYMGEQLKQPLDVKGVAASLNLKDNPYDDCEH